MCVPVEKSTMSDMPRAAGSRRSAARASSRICAMRPSCRPLVSRCIRAVALVVASALLMSDLLACCVLRFPYLLVDGLPGGYASIER